MIKAVTVTNYLNESIRIELVRPEQSGYIVKEISGLGPNKAAINITEMATYDGGFYNSSRLSTRNIVFSFIFLEKETIEDCRQMTYKYFPLKKNITLQFELDNRLVEIIGYTESNEPNIFDKSEGTDISIICPSPYFYSVLNKGNQITTFYGVDYLFEFPFSNESLTEKLIEFGKIQNRQENNLLYEGDVDTGITIIINALGEVGDITIYNITTRDSIFLDVSKLEKLTGYGIISGDQITICTERGSKSVTLLRNGIEINILNCIDRDVDWLTISKGDNLLAFTAEYGTTNLQFKIVNKILYEGI